MAKNYQPVSLLSVVSKIFEKVFTNRLVHRLVKSDFFMLGFLKDFVFGLIVFQSFTHDLPNDVISNTVYADCTTLLLM